MKYLIILFLLVYAYSNEPELQQVPVENKQPEVNSAEQQKQADINLLPNMSMEKCYTIILEE